MFVTFSVLLVSKVLLLLSLHDFQQLMRTSNSAVVPTALGTAFDVNLSNASLVFISVTFATMVGLFISYLNFCNLYIFCVLV